MNDPKCLVACAIGDAGPRVEWLDTKGTFDTLLVYFGCTSCAYEHQCDYFTHVDRKFKLENILYGLRAFPNLISEYDYFIFPDDDCRLRSKDIEALFSSLITLNLDAAHPAVMYVSGHVGMFPRLSLQYRLVKSIEMMCPIFTKEALLSVIDTFSVNRSGYGVDLLWGEIFLENNQRVAVLDDLPVFHFRRNEKPGEVYKKVLEQYGVDHVLEFAELDVSLNDFSICYEKIPYPSGNSVIHFISGLFKGISRSIELGCFFMTIRHILKMNVLRSCGMLIQITSFIRSKDK